MTQFAPGYNEKHRKEMEIKDLNTAEEGDFPCKLRGILMQRCQPAKKLMSETEVDDKNFPCIMLK